MENMIFSTEVNLPTMMKAIIQIANGQFQVGEIINNLGQRVEALENKSEETLTKMFKEYMTLSPEELSLANTMGYKYDGVIDVLSMKEIKARLMRMSFMFEASADTQWRAKVLKSIGKSLPEIRMEAQAFNIKNGIPTTIKTMYDAVETIKEYLKWGTAILFELEQKNGIHKNLYTRYDVFKRQNREFSNYVIENLGPVEYITWLNRRFDEIADMLDCSTDEAIQFTHKILSREVKRRVNYSKECEQFAYNCKTDFLMIASSECPHYLKSLCSYVIHKILVV